MKKCGLLILMMIVSVSLFADYGIIDGAKLMYNYYLDFIADSTLGTNNYGRIDGQMAFQNSFITWIQWADTVGSTVGFPVDFITSRDSTEITIQDDVVMDSTLESLKYNYTDATELTISSGAITVTQSAHMVDGESDVSDNLDTITGGTNGDYLILYPANAARDITIRSGADNILTSNGINYTIPNNGMVILYYNGSNWLAFTGGSTFPMPNDTYATWEDNAGTGIINAIKINTSGEIDIGANLRTGTIEFKVDSGVITGMDMPVSATPSDGDEESYYFRNDSNNNLGVNSMADGSGGVDEIWVEHARATIYKPMADQTRANDSAILVDNTIIRVAGDGGAAVLDTAPAIEDGISDGQMIIIQGTHDTNTVQIADNCNCQLAGGGAVTLGEGDTIQLIWDSGDSDWYEISRSNN